MIPPFNIITVIDKVNSSNHIGLGAPHGYISRQRKHIFILIGLPSSYNFSK